MRLSPPWLLSGFGRGVRLVEILIWLIKTVAEAVIRYSVSKVLDFIFKRR